MATLDLGLRSGEGQFERVAHGPSRYGDVFSSDMAWTVPQYSRTKVSQAGATYVDSSVSAEERELARVVINNWRSSHSFPLNTLQMNLRGVAASHDRSTTVAQRIKRLPSIRHKLERIGGMKLAGMQDIGGCRAVLSSVDAVERVARHYKSKSRMKHKLIREDPYIECPKESGYRGTHLVYAYNSDENETYNGLRIEMQLRSRLQHAWATAVETVGTFTAQALKSSWGEPEWLRFFALMSSALAMREGTPLVPAAPADPKELKRELRRHAKQLNVIERLAAYRAVVEFVEHQTAAKGLTFLLELEISEAGQTLEIRSYDNPVEATDAYDALEVAVEDQPGKDVVLVKVESLASLQRAFPNYFLDTTAFVEAVREAIE